MMMALLIQHASMHFVQVYWRVYMFNSVLPVYLLVLGYDTSSGR